MEMFGWAVLTGFGLGAIISVPVIRAIDRWLNTLPPDERAKAIEQMARPWWRP